MTTHGTTQGAPQGYKLWLVEDELWEEQIWSPHSVVSWWTGLCGAQTKQAWNLYFLLERKRTPFVLCLNFGGHTDLLSLVDSGAHGDFGGMWVQSWVEMKSGSCNKAESSIGLRSIIPGQVYGKESLWLWFCGTEQLAEGVCGSPWCPFFCTILLRVGTKCLFVDYAPKSNRS